MQASANVQYIEALPESNINIMWCMLRYLWVYAISNDYMLPIA